MLVLITRLSEAVPAGFCFTDRFGMGNSLRVPTFRCTNRHGAITAPIALGNISSGLDFASVFADDFSDARLLRPVRSISPGPARTRIRRWLRCSMSASHWCGCAAVQSSCGFNQQLLAVCGVGCKAAFSYACVGFSLFEKTLSRLCPVPHTLAFLSHTGGLEI
jgi:hypothetical protein